MRDYHIAGANVRRLELSSVAVLLLMLSGCCKPFDAPTKQENEAARAWVTASWRGQYDWTRIAQWKRVTESRILRAETLLRSIAVVRMTKEEAQELVGESNVTEENETPYLLRAVGDTVTGHDLFPRGSQIIFQPLSQIPFRPDRPTVATGRATAG